MARFLNSTLPSVTVLQTLLSSNLILFKSYHQSYNSALFSLSFIYSALLLPKLISRDTLINSRIITSLVMKKYGFTYGLKDSVRFGKIYWSASFEDILKGYPTGASGNMFISSALCICSLFLSFNGLLCFIECFAVLFVYPLLHTGLYSLH